MGWFKRLFSGSEEKPKQSRFLSQSPGEWAAARAAEREHLIANSAYARAQAQRAATGKPVPQRRKGPPRSTATQGGAIYRSDYLSSEREAELFTLGEDGMPAGYLEMWEKQLVMTPDKKPGAMVNPKSARLHKLGIYSFSVRGTSHHEQAVKSANLRPGKSVRLVREPQNPYDSNAIAIYAETGRHPIGYVNKQNAARLAKVMDAGQEIAAISTRGNGPGSVGLVPMILAARPEVLAHLMRRL